MSHIPSQELCNEIDIKLSPKRKEAYSNKRGRGILIYHLIRVGPNDI